MRAGVERRIPKRDEWEEGWRNCAECGSPAFAVVMRCGSCDTVGPICVVCLDRNHTFCAKEKP